MFQYLNDLTSTHWAPLPKGVYHAHIAPQAGEEASAREPLREYSRVNESKGFLQRWSGQV